MRHQHRPTPPSGTTVRLLLWRRAAGRGGERQYACTHTTRMRYSHSSHKVCCHVLPHSSRSRCRRAPQGGWHCTGFAAVMHAAASDPHGRCVAGHLLPLNTQTPPWPAHPGHGCCCAECKQRTVRPLGLFAPAFFLPDRLLACTATLTATTAVHCNATMDMAEQRADTHTQGCMVFSSAGACLTALLQRSSTRQLSGARPAHRAASPTEASDRSEHTR